MSTLLLFLKKYSLVRIFHFNILNVAFQDFCCNVEFAFPKCRPLRSAVCGRAARTPTSSRDALTRAPATALPPRCGGNRLRVPRRRAWKGAPEPGSMQDQRGWRAPITIHSPGTVLRCRSRQRRRPCRAAALRTPTCRRRSEGDRKLPWPENQPCTRGPRLRAQCLPVQGGEGRKIRLFLVPFYP